MNKQNLSVNEGEYEGYNIQFDLSFKEGGSPLQTKIKANAEQFEGNSIGNSIERGNSNTDSKFAEQIDDGGTSQVGGFTQNKKNILMNTIHDNQKNQVHEFGHTLGLDDNKNTGAKAGLMEYPPGKITQKEANQLGNSGFLPAVQKE